MTRVGTGKTPEYATLWVGPDLESWRGCSTTGVDEEKMEKKPKPNQPLVQICNTPYFFFKIIDLNNLSNKTLYPSCFYLLHNCNDHQENCDDNHMGGHYQTNVPTTKVYVTFITCAVFIFEIGFEHNTFLSCEFCLQI